MAGGEGAALGGLRVLVVEDVAVLAWRLRDLLVEAGAVVLGPVPSVAGALTLLTDDAVDAAVLDKNLDGASSDPIADVLTAQGVPFLFLTGYGSGDDEGRHGDRPTLSKPVKAQALITTLTAITAKPR